MILDEHSVPVAQSMLALAGSHLTHNDLARYVCLWAAFNNIYVTLGDADGFGVTLRRGSDGSVLTRREAGVEIPTVNWTQERILIKNAVRHVPETVSRDMLLHENTDWFAQRTPCWRGPIERDVRGQRLNGVINVGHTVSKEYPVWAPIDVNVYFEYVRFDGVHPRSGELLSQLVQILYTVRNNTAHGGKRADGAGDIEVVHRAAPLLEILVRGLIKSPDRTSDDAVDATRRV